MPPRAMAGVTGDFFPPSFTIKYILKKCFGLEISQFLPSNQSIQQPWSVARLSLPTPSFCSKIFWLSGCWWFGKNFEFTGNCKGCEAARSVILTTLLYLKPIIKKNKTFSWHDVSMDGRANASTFCSFTSALPYQSRRMDQRFYALPSLGYNQLMCNSVCKCVWTLLCCKVTAAGIMMCEEWSNVTMELQECCRLFASPQRAVPPRALPQIRDVFVCVWIFRGCRCYFSLLHELGLQMCVFPPSVYLI